MRCCGAAVLSATSGPATTENTEINTLREDGLCDAAVRGIGSGSIEVDGSRQSERAECRSEEDGPQHAC